MIIQENISDTLVRTYSDQGMYIHGGFPEANYEEAIDPINLNRTYVETDIPIEDWEEPEKMISEVNISKGQFFSIDEHLFYSTKTIIVGEEIVPGNNCEETNIANELNFLKGE